MFLNEIYVKKHVKRDPFDDFNWLNYCVCAKGLAGELPYTLMKISLISNDLHMQCVYNVKFVRIHMIKLSLVIVLTVQ